MLSASAARACQSALGARRRDRLCQRAVNRLECRRCSSVRPFRYGFAVYYCAGLNLGQHSTKTNSKLFVECRILFRHVMGFPYPSYSSWSTVDVLPGTSWLVARGTCPGVGRGGTCPDTHILHLRHKRTDARNRIWCIILALNLTFCGNNFNDFPYQISSIYLLVDPGFLSVLYGASCFVPLIGWTPLTDTTDWPFVS